MAYNLCKCGEMSICSESESPEKQTKCKFFIEATHAHRCMYLQFDEFCTSLKAQMDCQKNINERNQELMEEIEEGKLE